jgi:hypothetical protein
VRHCEWALTQKRDAVASGAWRSSAAGLLSAVESLPGVESEWDREAPPECGEIHDAPCQACNRRVAHVTRRVAFKGRPVPPAIAAAGPGHGAGGWEDGPSNRRLSDSFNRISPAYRRRQAEAGAAAPPQPAAAGGDDTGPGAAPYQIVRFRVGRYCAARLLLYHGLFHWKRRLLARLKRELKAELRRRRRRGGGASPGEVADALLSRDSLLASLYGSYQEVLSLAERYQLSGGEGGGGGGWRAEFSEMHAEVTRALAGLHDDSEGEEGSVVWPEEGEEEEGAGASGSEDDAGGGAGGGPGARSTGARRAAGGGGTQSDIRSFLGAR